MTESSNLVINTWKVDDDGNVVANVEVKPGQLALLTEALVKTTILMQLV